MLTKLLQKLLAHKYRKNHQLAGGLWLHWMPPNELWLSRKGQIPSPQEVKTIETHLKNLSYTFTTSRLQQKTDINGKTWFYYKLVTAYQPAIFKEPQSSIVNRQS